MKRLHEYTDEELSVATKLDVRVIDIGDAPTTDEELARLSLCACSPLRGIAE